MTSRELIFLHSGFTPQCTARLDKHFDGYHTLQFLSDGAVEVGYDERAYTLAGAWFWPAFPGPRIRFHVAPGHTSWPHRYVAFQGPLVGRWASEGLLLSAPQPAPGAHDAPEYACRFDELLVQAQRTDRWGKQRAVNLLERLLLELAEERAQNTPGEPWLRAVLDGLSEEGNFAPNYAELAAQAGMAVTTLRRRFKQATGIALHGYVLQSRLAAARSLLGETDLPVKAIAERLGYNDVYFFCRQFRQQIGVPPAAYRKSRQA